MNIPGISADVLIHRRISNHDGPSERHYHSTLIVSSSQMSRNRDTPGTDRYPYSSAEKTTFEARLMLPG